MVTIKTTWLLPDLKLKLSYLQNSYNSTIFSTTSRLTFVKEIKTERQKQSVDKNHFDDNNNTKS